jgi:hypothetical protein
MITARYVRITGKEIKVGFWKTKNPNYKTKCKRLKIKLF